MNSESLIEGKIDYITVKSEYNLRDEAVPHVYYLKGLLDGLFTEGKISYKTYFVYVSRLPGWARHVINHP